MIGNNRHSDRTFVSEHICGRLAPSAGHADARLLARPPVFTLAASLSRSLSISFLLSFLAYLLSFSTPVFFSLAHPRPPYAVPSRSPLALVPPPVSIPVRIGASSAPLSRRRSSFEASLSAAVHNHPPAARSVLVEFAARSPLRHRAHLRILLARALHPFRRSVPVSIRSETALYFSLLFSPPSRLPFPSPSFSLSPLFSFSDQRFFARRLCIVWCLVCGTYIIQARGCVRVHPGRPSRAHLAPRGDARVRIASIRVHGEKKMGGCIVGACHRGV